MKANSSGAINEYPNGDNNLFVSPLNITALPPADLMTSAVAAPDQALDGETVSVQYTVSNLGLGPTDVANWTDTIWLCVDRKRPNPSKGDVLLATLPHSGLLGNDPSVLDPPQSYTVSTTVTLPTHITGQYFITPWADSLDNVLKSTQSGNVNPDDPNELNNDNYKARPITILLTPPPDLVVTSIAPQPTGVGGDSFTVQWTVSNQGGSDTEDSTLFDKVYLSDNATLNAAGAQQWLLGTVEHEGVVAAGGSYTAQQTIHAFARSVRQVRDRGHQHRQHRRPGLGLRIPAADLRGPVHHQQHDGRLGRGQPPAAGRPASDVDHRPDTGLLRRSVDGHLDGQELRPRRLGRHPLLAGRGLPVPLPHARHGPGRPTRLC